MVKGPVFIRLGEVLFDSKGIRYHTLLYVQRLNSSKLHGSELYKLGAVAYIYYGAIDSDRYCSAMEALPSCSRNGGPPVSICVLGSARGACTVAQYIPDYM